MSKPIFPIIPDRSPIIERLEYRTDLYEAWDGTEQRVRLRDKAWRYLEFPFTVQKFDRAILDAWLFGNVYQSEKQFTVPNWQDIHALTSAYLIGNTVITVPTTERDFEVDGLAVFMSASRLYNRERAIPDYEYEVATIASKTASTITLAAPGLVSAWALGTLCMPAREGWLASAIPSRDVNDQAEVFRGRVRFRLEVV